MKPHLFSMLWCHFGPHGDQTVHIHPCVSEHECSLVIVGSGWNCAGRNDGTHRKVELDESEIEA